MAQFSKAYRVIFYIYNKKKKFSEERINSIALWFLTTPAELKHHREYTRRREVGGKKTQHNTRAGFVPAPVCMFSGRGGDGDDSET